MTSITVVFWYYFDLLGLVAEILWRSEHDLDHGGSDSHNIRTLALQSQGDGICTSSLSYPDAANLHVLPSWSDRVNARSIAQGGDHVTPSPEHPEQITCMQCGIPEGTTPTTTKTD